MIVLSADNIDFDPVNPNLTPDATIVADIPSPFCEGETALLTVASGEDTYEWYKDGQAIGLNQNFLFAEESGNYHVEITDGQCNAISEVVELTVSDGPDLGSLPSGETAFCENETLLVEAPDTFNQYVWLKDGGVYQQGGSTLEITEEGNYNLLAYYNGCSATSDTLFVSIAPVPEATILNENTIICEGDELILEANDGGEQYIWFLDNQEIGQSSQNNFTIDEGGDYQVEVVEGICTALSDPVTVTESPLPDVELSFLGLVGTVIDDQVYLCYDESFVLAVPADENSEFQWFKDGQEVSNTTNAIEIDEAGIYHVEVINENDCFNESLQIPVFISQPIASITFDGQILTSDDQWTTYQWFMDGNILDGETNQTYAPTATGEYHCVITNEFGCESVSNYIQVLIEGLGNIEGLSTFSLFPNPVEDILNIEISTTERLNFDIKIIHANGQVIENSKVETYGQQNISFDLNELASGVYMIKLQSEGNQIIKRFVKI